MGDCDLTDEEYFEQPKSQEEIEMDNICKECNLSLEKNVRLDEIIGKTIKFCNRTHNRKNDTVLIIFIDDTFLILDSAWENITDSVSFTLKHDEDYQNLMISGNLISKEKVDKFNNFWLNRQKEIEKENDLFKLKELLAKYPDFENK